jgi:hypothetical protein
MLNKEQAQKVARWSQPAGMGGPDAVSGGPPPVDASGVGDGTIGTGNVPVAGEDGFTGNPPEPQGQ